MILTQKVVHSRVGDGNLKVNGPSAVKESRHAIDERMTRFEKGRPAWDEGSHAFGGVVSGVET
jgi:hypothetical protein